MRSKRPAVWLALLALAPASGLVAQEGKGGGGGEKPLAERIAGFEKREGLLDLYLDRDGGTVWLKLDADAGPEVGSYLYVEGLATGLGSNPVGLDRGQLGDARLVTLRRVGNRLVVEEENLRYRALSDDPAERRATRQSFATSVLWAGRIQQAPPGEDAWVDLGGFLVRDAHGVVATMRDTGQGKFKLDPERSAVDLDACLVFPDNLELEALLTYAGEEPGAHVRSTAPTPEAVTLVQHHSLIRLPGPGYEPRAFDPREGSFAVEFADYAAPLDRPLVKRWIVRHRLHKVDPAAERSAVREPIVYYVDPGIPEPVRSAVLDGARWWGAAFDEAGFDDAYRVELLPEGAHPLDVRYNVIQWVHRSTRGWSYGGGVIDPRTGEMIKGHVSLGSLRVRQDRLIFEGLAGTAKTGTGAPDDPVELALARIRQLSAHEVGHTLGITHNFAASTYDGRASVMDYPAPLVTVAPDGALDFSQAYGVGVGSWDRHAVRWAYSEFPPGTDEAAALEAIVQEGIAAGLLFITDHDARPPGAAQPVASLWDNGSDPVEQLAVEMAVRRIALARFGEANLRPGRPLALLQEVLAPLYFRHRYQVEATAKMLGGVDYRYNLRGDGQPLPRPVPAADQRRALAELLRTLAPEALDLPDGLLASIPPRPFGYGPNRELFRGATAPLFDPLSAAATAAALTVGNLLQPERAARMIDLHRRDPELPGFDEVVDGLVEQAFGGGDEEVGTRRSEIRQAVQQAVVDRLISLARSEAPPVVRARAEWALGNLAIRLSNRPTTDRPTTAFRALLARTITRYLERDMLEAERPAAAPEMPPGSPIGSGPGHLTGCSHEDRPAGLPLPTARSRAVAGVS